MSKRTSIAAQKALDIIHSEPDRRHTLKANADHLRNRLIEADMDIGDSTTHIVPVIIGPAKRTVEIAQQLFDAGFFVAAIRPPTVPEGSSRLRISLQYKHTKQQIDELCDMLVKLSDA